MSNKLYKFLPELLVNNPLQQRCAIDGDWNDDDLGVNQRTAWGDSLVSLRSTATGPHSASGTVIRHEDKWRNFAHNQRNKDRKGGKFEEKERQKMKENLWIRIVKGKRATGEKGKDKSLEFPKSITYVEQISN